jgi:hypothetical protein
MSPFMLGTESPQSQEEAVFRDEPDCPSECLTCWTDFSHCNTAHNIAGMLHACALLAVAGNDTLSHNSGHPCKLTHAQACMHNSSCHEHTE